MSASLSKQQTDDMFYAAEKAGLTLAIKGRIVTVIFVSVLMTLTRDAERAPDFILGGALFTALGLVHFWIIGSVYDRPWVKYLFITIDMLLLSTAVAFMPAEPQSQVPQIMIFRFQVLPFYFLVLAIAAFSFSPGLVFWSGLVGSAGWLAAFFYIRSGMERVLEWSDIPQPRTTEEFLAVFLNVDFVGTGTRMQETAVFLVTAVLIAIVMQRARNVVKRQLEAERGIESISRLFGQFVPQMVANSMIEQEGVLAPVEREATILIADVAGFTALTETKGAQAIVDTFNAYFEAASEVISAHDGIVTQFIGDAVLATFNVPVEDTNHRQNGVDAAVALLDKVAGSEFAGERLNIRIGVSTGPVIAGNVGGGGRAAYTVYGEAVNLASRLEALNKEHATSLLISEHTAQGINQKNLKRVGQADVRGMSRAVDIYSID